MSSTGNILKLGLTQKILVKLGIPIFTQFKSIPLSKGELPFFAFNCSKHGIVENYKQGHEHVLYCPECQSAQGELT